MGGRVVRGAGSGAGRGDLRASPRFFPVVYVDAWTVWLVSTVVWIHRVLQRGVFKALVGPKA